MHEAIYDAKLHQDAPWMVAKMPYPDRTVGAITLAKDTKALNGCGYLGLLSESVLHIYDGSGHYRRFEEKDVVEWLRAAAAMTQETGDAMGAILEQLFNGEHPVTKEKITWQTHPVRAVPQSLR